MTYRDLIQAALQDLQILGAGDVLSADDAQYGLDHLNDWIDGLALEGLTMPQIAGTTWPLVPGLGAYRIGDGVTGPGTINVPKPVSPQAIQNVGYYDTTITPTQFILFGAVLTDQTQFALTQTAPAPVPTGFWYDPTTATTGNLYPVPVPTRAALGGVIWAPGLWRPVLLTDPVVLPAGYRRFFRSNLSVELAAAFEKPVPPSIARIASESMARVKTANLRVTDLGMDPAVPGVGGAGYDIRTDT